MITIAANFSFLSFSIFSQHSHFKVIFYINLSRETCLFTFFTQISPLILAYVKKNFTNSHNFFINIFLEKVEYDH